jgi:single-strand DNA-binding protein
MPSYNRCVFVGHLTTDIELTYDSQGNAYTRFSLGINEYKGEKEIAHFFRFTAFGKTAENMSVYCKKGNPILVEGRAQQNNWEDKEGNKRSDVQFIADRVVFLSSKPKTASPESTDDQDI